MKKSLLLAMLLLLVGCSLQESKQEKAVFNMPDQVSLQATSKDYLTDTQIESIVTYGDVVGLITKLGEALLADVDNSLDEASDSEGLYYAGQRMGIEIAVEALQQGMEEAIKESNYGLTDAIPDDKKEEVIEGLKEIRGAFEELLNDFQEGLD